MRASIATLLAGLALLLTGLFFGSPPVELPGIALIILVLGVRAWVGHAVRRLRINPRPGPATTVECEPYPVSRRIDGANRLTPGGWIEHPLLDDPVTLPAPLPDRVDFDLRFPRRGRHSVGAATLVVADPLGLNQVRLTAKDKGRVLVLPRIEPIELEGLDGGPDGVSELAHLESLLDGSASVRSAGMDVDVDGLRPHQPGSPSSRIHWPTVARTGQMFERLLVANADGGPLVVLDASNPSSPEALDSAVRATASLCHALASVGGCSVLIGARDRPTPIDRSLRSWPATHAALALIEPGSRPPSTRARRLEPAFWVTAGDAARAPVGSLAPNGFVVSPNPSQPRTLFTVAGCSGQSVRAMHSRRQAVAA